MVRVIAKSLPFPGITPYLSSTGPLRNRLRCYPPNIDSQLDTMTSIAARKPRSSACAHVETHGRFRARKKTVVVFAITVAVLSCGDSITDPVAPSSVSIQSGSAAHPIIDGKLSIAVGQTIPLTAIPEDSRGVALTGRSVAWLSTDRAKAGISSEGHLTGLKVGTATIVASVEGKSALVVVTVAALIATAPAEYFTAVSIESGADFTCGLTSAGAAYCWGGNDYGKLGDGTSGTDRLAPVAVLGGLTFQSIAPGHFHTCGVTTAGAAYCWGDNESGALGTGDSTSTNQPVAVAGGLTFQSITTGQYHTCGLTTDGAAYCWGDFSYGTSSYRYGSPLPVAVGGGMTFQSISAGSNHTCALTPSGAAYCWGLNDVGQIGNGGDGREEPTPVAVLKNLNFRSVTSGAYHTCGLTSAGAAFCWGLNMFGQLGDGGQSNGGEGPVPVSGGLAFQSLSAGQWVTCGVTATATLYCWGANLFGQYGIGTIGAGTGEPWPIPAGTGLIVYRVSVGAIQTCALGRLRVGSSLADSQSPAALQRPEVAYCWGINTGGALGDGTSVQFRLLPVPVIRP